MIKNKKDKFDLDVVLCSILAFTLPITNYSVYIFATRIELQRVLISLCILRLVIKLVLPSNLVNHRKKLVLSIFLPVFLTIIYALFLTTFQPDFIKSIRFSTDAEIYGFIIKRGYKYLSYVLLAIYLGLILKTEAKIHTVLCSLAAILCIAEVLGIIQSLVFIGSGVDIFPINRTTLSSDYTTNFTQSVAINLLGLKFLRINSLAHEPKALGVFITFLFFMKLYWSKYKQEIHSKKIPYLDAYMSRTLVCSITVIILTFSGSALFSLLFGLIIATFIEKKHFNFNRKYLIYSTVFIFVILLTFLIAPSISIVIDSFFQVSVLRRMQKILMEFSTESFYASLDPEDGATLYNILNYPNIVFSGLGFGAYSNVSFVYFSKYYSQGISPFSRNILIETMFSVGLPGFILLSCFFYKINIKFNFYNYYNTANYLPLMLNIIILINVFLRANEPLFFMAIGMLCALYVNRFSMYTGLQKYLRANNNNYYFTFK